MLASEAILNGCWQQQPPLSQCTQYHQTSVSHTAAQYAARARWVAEAVSDRQHATRAQPEWRWPKPPRRLPLHTQQVETILEMRLGT